ncbi:MAG: hypothetical protein A2W99_09455 [Bacteroidetes bacterium GWF2_33_16]|nr:MAG: hypothetical protein A2X00_06365 [Bacteroidetes bacterium GWE2_32_14]OFY07223.1 MAG: hypothetical protein A2W99_09455 [Bacteroidetes bacterium GWF2_33_16]
MKTKILLLIIGVLTSMSLFSQVPEKFNYQGVIRNSSGELVKNTSVTVKLSLLQGNSTDTLMYSENHSVTTNNFGQFSVKVGAGSIFTGSFSDIDWSTEMYIKTEIANPAGGTFIDMGTIQLISVPYSLYSGKAKTLDNSTIYLTDNDTLFAVKDRQGNVIFAVFPDGVKVIVNQVTKGSVGGFAVSGRTPTKALEEDYFRVTLDSTIIYINDTASTKGSVGGFAVSGRTPTKEKQSANYFNISGYQNIEIINPSEARIVWYPRKEAFLAGRVLIESADSIGTNSMAIGYESKAIGDWSQALGYQAITRNDYSTAIGRNVIAKGLNSFAFGNNAIARGAGTYAIGDGASTGSTSSNSYAIGRNAFAAGSGSYAFGNGAIATANGSFAFGAGGRDSTGVSLAISTEALGQYSFAMGLGAKSYGLNSFSIGTGTTTTITGDNSTAMGFGTIASGRYAIALGYRNTASGRSSMTWGGARFTNLELTNTASGDAATAFGSGTVASGNNSTAFGDYTVASGFGSTAWGHYSKATGYGSTAWGWGSKAHRNENTAWLGAEAVGYNTTAAGEGVMAHSYRSIVLGRSNDTIYSHRDINYYDNTTPFSYIDWYEDDPLFVLGNGSSHPLVGRRNALTILKDGTTVIGWAGVPGDNTITNPDTRYNASVKTKRDAGYKFYVHGKAGGNQAWASDSDGRLKKNIETIDGALDKVLKLRGVTFDWNDPSSSEKQIGFIAQEVIGVLPEVVVGNEQTNYSIQYAPVTSLLVEALKEEHKKVQDLEKQVIHLQNQLNEVMSILKK